MSVKLMSSNSIFINIGYCRDRDPIRRIILDIGIGTDVDDALALALAIKSRKDIDLRLLQQFMGIRD